MSSEDSSGYRWQDEAAAFLRILCPGLVVETGVSDGVSTIRFLAALDAAQHGKLISIDPSPSYTTPHPRWTLIQNTSHKAIDGIYRTEGPFDVFVHDSDHEAECQAFEYAVAWEFVKPGGYVISDDITWGTHRAWQEFTAAHDLIERRLGHAGLVQKPVSVPCPSPSRVERVLWDASTAAQEFARRNGEAPRYWL